MFFLLNKMGLIGPMAKLACEKVQLDDPLGYCILCAGGIKNQYQTGWVLDHMLASFFEHGSPLRSEYKIDFPR